MTATERIADLLRYLREQHADASPAELPMIVAALSGVLAARLWWPLPVSQTTAEGMGRIAAMAIRLERETLAERERDSCQGRA